MGFDNSCTFLMCQLTALPFPITNKLSIDRSVIHVAQFLQYELWWIKAVLDRLTAQQFVTREWCGLGLIIMSNLNWVRLSYYKVTTRLAYTHCWAVNLSKTALIHNSSYWRNCATWMTDLSLESLFVKGNG